MSKSVKLSPALPGNEDTNGLDCWASRLVRDEETVVLALVVLDVASVTKNRRTGDVVPMVQIRKIEPIADDHATRQKTAELFVSLSEERLGMSPIPFEQLEGRTERVEVVREAGDDDE